MALLVRTDVSGPEWEFLLDARPGGQSDADAVRCDYGDDDEEYEDFGSDEEDDFDDDLDDDFDDDDEFDDDSDDVDDDDDLDDDDL